MNLQDQIDQLRDHHEENVYIINGNKKNLFLGMGALITPILISIFTFWFGFYPNIATEAYVEKKVQSAPWTKDKPLVQYRIERLEENYKKILEKLEGLKVVIEESR